MRLLHIIIGFAIVALIVTSTSQVSAQVPSSKGREFYLTFLPNFHNGAAGNDSLDSDWRRQHEVYIYIGAENPTTGRIVLTDFNGQQRVVPFQINNPAQLYEFSTFFRPYELQGYNYSGRVDVASSQTELPAKQSVFIEADNDVTVYALNQADLTSDALLVLPVTSLGSDYVISSFYSDVSFNFNGNVSTNATPSQFALVATENNTTIRITPTVPTLYSAAGAEFTVELQRGESYLVQARPNDESHDLTGTRVRADKPIAVFAGHQRSRIPKNDATNAGSRDHLVEQMNPVGTWGRSAFVTPLTFGSDEFRTSNNLYRVVAAFNGTEVSVNEQVVDTIDAGEFYEAPLLRDYAVTTSRAASVSILKKSAGPVNTEQISIGDPFMMMVPPAEQFMDQYRFVNIQALSYRNQFGDPIPPEKIYVEQWLNVVIPTSSAASLRIDGNPVVANFQPIGPSTFSYAQIPMTDGVHEITADEPFGIYVYGYGRANSYGYIGGMAFRPLDIEPPNISGRSVCGVFSGTVTDTLLGDTKVTDVQVVAGSEVNVVYTQGAFNPPQAVVPFQATLIDPFADGRITLRAKDQVLQSIETTVIVPGFTVGVVGRGSDPEPEKSRKTLALKTQRCDTVQIENYGTTARTITILEYLSGAPILEPTLPIRIRPGERVNVVTCRTFNEHGIQTDSLIIGDSCLKRNLAEFEFDVRDDEEPPGVAKEADDCLSRIEIAITETSDFDFGLETVTILTDVQQNCTVAKGDSGVFRQEFVVTVTDPFFDAIYGFVAIDSGGNTQTFIDTIPGFTLAVNGDQGAFSSSTLQPVSIGEMRCDSLTLFNYGVGDIELRSVFIRGNQQFSLPQNQFPIIIPSGGTSDLVVCYEPFIVQDEIDTDTIELGFRCSQRILEVRGSGSERLLSGLTRCNVPAETRMYSIGRRVVAIPQPANEMITLVVPEESTNIDVRVVNIHGQDMMSETYNGLATQSVIMNISSLPVGTYGVFVRTEHGTSSTLIIVE